MRHAFVDRRSSVGACLPTVWASRVRFLVSLFLITNGCNGFGGRKILFIFASLHLFVFFHPYSRSRTTEAQLVSQREKSKTHRYFATVVAQSTQRYRGETIRINETQTCLLQPQWLHCISHTARSVTRNESRVECLGLLWFSKWIEISFFCNQYRAIVGLAVILWSPKLI
jgi:hypothetical protein